MKCPNCQGDLNEVQYKGVRIHECEKCDGKWFDKDELKQAKDKTDDDLRWLDFELFNEESNKFASSVSKKHCPKDDSAMTSLTYEDSGVVIDKCNTCRGVWLDKDEFEKIIKHLKKVVVSQPASEYAKDALEEFKEILTGPENRISEIKDFLAVMKFFEMRLAVENPWTINLSNAINKYWPLK